MRPLVVLAILALGLLAAILMRKEREADFDNRFDRAEQRIRDLAEDIDQEVVANPPEEAAQPSSDTSSEAYPSAPQK